MSRLARFTQKIFGSSAGASDIAKFGSLAAGVPSFTSDPGVIQSLGNYLQGWFGAVIGANSPAIEDMNAISYLFAFQLAYLMQMGTAEWDAGTTYYKGSLVNNGGGLVYVSLIDTNLNQALSDTTKWKVMNGPAAYDIVVGSGPFCTHATLAAAVADSATVANARVLLTSDFAITSVINLTKARWHIDALPNVTYSKSGSANGISCQADGIEISRLRFTGFSTAGNKAITGNASWTYGRVLFCNFNSCDTEIDDSNSPAGKKPVALGNISE